MNEAREEKPTATTDLPLQAQLMGSLALVCILSVIAGVIGYATFDGASLENTMKSKSNMYATSMSSQLGGAMVTGDAQLAAGRHRTDQERPQRVRRRGVRARRSPARGPRPLSRRRSSARKTRNSPMTVCW